MVGNSVGEIDRIDVRTGKCMWKWHLIEAGPRSCDTTVAMFLFFRQSSESV